MPLKIFLSVLVLCGAMLGGAQPPESFPFQLRPAQARDAALARALALAGSPDNLSHYTQCDFGPFKVEQSSEMDRPSNRTVWTAKGDQKIEVAHSISLHIAYEGIPFVTFKAEKLGTAFAASKQTLIDSVQYVGARPEMEAVTPWPSAMSGFEVYGINRKEIAGGVLSIYLLFRDADQTVITLYMVNMQFETQKFGTMEEYRVLRDRFLNVYTACAGAQSRAPRQ